MKLTPEAARLLLERKRRKDPVHWFFRTANDPHSLKQRAIFEDAERDGVLFRAVLAGGRAGKSATTALDIAATIRGIHPYRKPVGRPFRGALLMPQRKQANDIWKVKLLKRSELGGPHVPRETAERPMIPDVEIARCGWDSAAGLRVPTEVELHNGNLLRFIWTESPASWKSFQGGQWDWLWVDEGAMSLDMLNEAYQRLKDTQSDPSMPGYGGIHWSATMTSADYEGYQRFLDQCDDPDFRWARRYTLLVEENPAISEEANEISSKAWGEAEAKVRLSGGMAGDKTMVYPQLREEVHTVESYEPSAHANIWMLYDPGSGHQAGLSLFGIEPDSRQTLRLWRYWEPEKQTLRREAELIAETLQGRWLEGVIFDPAAKQTQKRLDGLTSQLDLMMDALKGVGYSVAAGTIKRPPIASDNDEYGSTNRVEAGIRQVRQLLMEGNFKCPLDDYEAAGVVESDGSQRRIVGGGRLAWRRLRRYRFRDGTVSTDVGKPIKKDDEFPDLLRYITRWHLAGRIRYESRKPNLPTGALSSAYAVDAATIRRMRSERIARDAMRDQSRDRRGKRRRR